MHFFKEEDIQTFHAVKFLFIRTVLENHVFEIILNRPAKRNAFTPTMAAEIAFALAYANSDAEIRCVVVKAEGPVFCAGADLNAFHDASADERNLSLPEPTEEIRLGNAFVYLNKPSVAIVQGPVLAGGFLIICGCTFVLCTQEATFSLPEVKRGIWPMQVMASLLDIVPRRKILEMSVTGNIYQAEEALHMGLVTQIAGRDVITDEAKKLTTLICSNAPLAIRSGMQALQNLSGKNADDRHAYLKNQLDILLKSEDAKEGTSAFKEKRAPVWKGK